MGLIWYLSSRELKNVPNPFSGFDKLIHVVEFAGLALLLSLATQKKHLYWVFVLAWAYGGLDELHQGWGIGRNPDFYDYLADGLGAALVCAFFKKSQLNQRNDLL